MYICFSLSISLPPLGRCPSHEVELEVESLTSGEGHRFHGSPDLRGKSRHFLMSCATQTRVADEEGVALPLRRKGKVTCFSRNYTLMVEKSKREWRTEEMVR